MMWLVGGSFVLAGVLLALISIPESVWGRITIPVSISIGLIFIFVPFIARKRALTYDKDCFRHAIVEILGKGLMKRSVLTTDALIREIQPHEPKKALLEVVEKFAQTQNRKISKYEEICLIKQLLDGYNPSRHRLIQKGIDRLGLSDLGIRRDRSHRRFSFELFGAAL